ncbi:transposase [Microbispora hainanensis]|uniref:transposase n=1 Tax=Microbispora hainanensis TaxID=568844 RepID=UPI002E29303E|nr:transposase [Microbispora hainanensis]
MGETRRRFDPEFRAGAVRIVRETGKSIAQVARDLGINAGTLANWVQMDRLAREQDTGSGVGELAESEREELARLRRQKAEWAKERAERWSVMSSSARWSSGSRKRRAGERGGLHRFPEDRA